MSPSRSVTQTAPAVRRPRTYGLLFAVVAVGWIALDQITKAWADSALRDGDVDVVWTLRFRLAFNSGASFSMGPGYGPWIAAAALVIVAVLVWQGRTAPTRLAAVALALIVGGAVGNVLDRAFRGDSGVFGGSVIDFIDLQFWPIFNVADTGVVVGAVLLIISAFRAPPDTDPVAVSRSTDGVADRSPDPDGV